MRKRFGYFCDKGSRLLPAAPEARKLACLPKPRVGGSTPLLDFGKKRLETLARGVSISGQPGLEQTQKTKSVVDTQRRVTPGALFRLMRYRSERISEAIE